MLPCRRWLMWWDGRVWYPFWQYDSVHFLNLLCRKNSSIFSAFYLLGKLWFSTNNFPRGRISTVVSTCRICKKGKVRIEKDRVGIWIYWVSLSQVFILFKDRHSFNTPGVTFFHFFSSKCYRLKVSHGRYKMFMSYFYGLSSEYMKRS